MNHTMDFYGFIFSNNDIEYYVLSYDVKILLMG